MTSFPSNGADMLSACISMVNSAIDDGELIVPTGLFPLSSESIIPTFTSIH